LISRDELASESATILAAPKNDTTWSTELENLPMARGNRISAVRGNRNPLVLCDRRRIEREVALTIRDGMKVLRLVFRGVALIVRYHDGGETEEAFGALRVGAGALVEAARRLGLGDRAIAELILDPIEDEVGMMYDAETADRLMHAFRCFNKPGLREPR
jgi:hypothetical protein